MAKITYDELPSAAREAYDKLNKRRKVLLFFAWAVAVAGFVLGMMLSLSADSGNPLSGILVGLFSGVLFGGIVSGLDHLGFLFKKAVKHGILLIIILGLWYIAVFSAICMLAYFSGWVFLIVDTIKFILKKPLVSQKEIARIFESQQVQAGLMVQAYGGAVEPSAADRLAELKEMLDSGLITEEEFNAKKAELLSSI